MDAIFKAILEAPLPNLLTVAGLIFVGLAILGGVSGKFQADKQGRIAGGILGGVLLLAGVYLQYGVASLPSSVRSAVTTPLDAPLPNLLIVAGLLFTGLAVVGGITGKIEPDRQGRIASGVVGGALMLAGFFALLTGAGQSPSARLEATALPATATAIAPTATVVAPSPSPTAVPPTATPPPPTPTAQATSAVAGGTTYFKEHRESELTVGADRRVTISDTWTVRFGSVPQRQFFVSVNSGQDINDFAAAEATTPYTASGSLADDTYEVQRTVGADNVRTYVLYWHFPATANQTRTFLIRYSLTGLVSDTTNAQALRYTFYGGGGGAVGSEHLTIRLPRSYNPSQLTAQMQTNGADQTGARVLDGQTIDVSAQNLPASSQWTIQVRYPAP